MTTTVVLVDDHQMMREGLRAVLEKAPRLQIVGEAADGRVAVAMVAELRPDIVIMDVGLPGLNGIDATRRIVSGARGTRVVALSMHSDKRYVLEMLRAGASAYLLKNSASDELIAAIDAVLKGQRFLSPAIASTVVDEALQESPTATTGTAFSAISDREREVLQILAEGRTSKEIAAELHVSVKTVETHRREIMRKLDLHSVAELTKYAVREGLTSLET
jgi:DNA-binding NarL/FixJ family response regulator